ncbi:flagellar biosynthetic protein FliQ [uncultured Umboniibacter sp.]|uniref:flagellar biosynthetic protein FliQ n=1 Tax=uncultured Umboniibacter sp. TaxID=1798917 RepID=UPI00261FBDC3|nr:flagellar biosynthetic protein FliQ [uncultured Umboniibacter sp.]
MSEADVANLLSQGIWVVLKIVAVIIIPGMLLGLVVAAVQSATQINEQTLSFLPRLMVTFLTIIATGPWIIGELTGFFEYLLHNLHVMVR